MSILGECGSLAQELVRYCRLCYERHLVGAAGGNLSARVPGRDAFIVTATGVSLRDVTLDNLMIVDGGGRVVEGPVGARPSKESGFHLAVFEARPEICSVIHVHPPHATVFSMRRQLIPTVTISAQLKLKQGVVIASAAPGSKELRELVAQGVKTSAPESTVFLMEAHGLLAMGRTLGGAFDDAELAEDTAKIAYLAELAPPRAFRLPEATHVVDLSTPLHEGIRCYPTDPVFSKHWHTRFDEHGVCVAKLEMGSHTGTHVDAPMHFLGDSFPDVSQMAPQLFLGEAIALDRPTNAGQNLRVSDLQGAEIRPGDIVLFRTGWDARSNSPAFFEGEWPGLEPSLMEELIRRGVKGTGGDIASADSPAAIAAGAAAHKIAGRAGMPIFEALVNLDRLVGRRFFFVGLPLKLEGVEASPIRALAIVAAVA
jgi:kynurenine formamidase/ribulose-5-phosphate 4-epimerase/fuculose-1-phosphate aldolase